MKYLKKGLLIMFLPLFAFTAAHKFYLSVTNVNYSEKDDALQITSRVFIDDLDLVLKERYDVNAQLATDKESKMADVYLKKYLNAKFAISINGENRPYEIIGREYEDDVCVFYLEISRVQLSTLKTIEIENELLTDLFGKQQNVVHIKIKDKKKSFVLLKSDTKGMLKL